MRSPVMLNAGWVEPGAAEYLAPNCTAEAARDLGIEDDRVWLALIKAELLEGKKTGRWEFRRKSVPGPLESTVTN